MRQKHETATSFNQLKEVTQAIMLKRKRKKTQPIKKASQRKKLTTLTLKPTRQSQRKK